MVLFHFQEPFLLQLRVFIEEVTQQIVLPTIRRYVWSLSVDKSPTQHLKFKLLPYAIHIRGKIQPYNIYPW